MVMVIEKIYCRYTKSKSYVHYPLDTSLGILDGTSLDSLLVVYLVYQFIRCLLFYLVCHLVLSLGLSIYTSLIILFVLSLGLSSYMTLIILLVLSLGLSLCLSNYTSLIIILGLLFGSVIYCVILVGIFKSYSCNKSTLIVSDDNYKIHSKVMYIHRTYKICTLNKTKEKDMYVH